MNNTEEQILKNIENFYNNYKIFSYSSLSRFIESPFNFFQNFVIENKREYTVSGREGSLIHCLLLDPEELNNKFIVSTEDVPSEGPKKIIDRLYSEYYLINNIEDIGLFKEILLDLLRQENLYQSLKTDDQRLEKLLTPKNLNYWNFLISRDNKHAITTQMLEDAKNVVSIVVENQDIINKLGYIESNTTEYFNEYHINCPYNAEFGLYGVIDNLVIHHDDKVIRINDIKTTTKPLKDFQYSINTYKYWLQAAIYKKLVESQIKNGYFPDYKIEFSFIVIDNYVQTGIIKIGDETMDEYTRKTEVILNDLEAHLKLKNFRAPLDFLKNNSEITI